MTLVKGTSEIQYLALADDSGSVVIAEALEPGTWCATPHQLVIATPSEQKFLAAVKGKAGGVEPLPSPGEHVEAGKIYANGDDAVIARQSHTRTQDPPESVPALFLVYRENAGDVLEWIPNESVIKGMKRKSGSDMYVCIQSHTTQADWEPSSTPSLWSKVVEQVGNEWQVGVFYKVGVEVTFKGASYACITPHKSQSDWTPPVAFTLWKKV